MYWKQTNGGAGWRQALSTSEPVSRAERLTFWLTLAVVLYFVVPPVVYMVWTSLTPGGRYGIGGSFSFSAYFRVFTAPSFGNLLTNSIIYTIGSVMISTTLGGLMAWLVERTNSSWKAMAYLGAFVGFAVPGILRIIGWVLLLGPGGFAQRYLVQWLGHEVTRFNILNMVGMIGVEALIWTPPAFLMLVGPFRAMDPSLEEAAAVSGASTLRTIRSITLRLLTPSVLSVLLLTSIRVFEGLEVPLIMGIPANVSVFTSYIYEEVARRPAPDYAISSAYGVIMVVVLSVVLYFYYLATREASRFQTVTGKGFRPRVMDLGSWRWVGGAYLVLMFLIQAIPVVFLLFASFIPSLGVSGPLWHQLTLDNYRKLAAFPGVVESMVNSLIIGLITATAVVLLVTVAAWVVARSRLALRWVLEMSMGFPLVFPGVIMSLAVLVMYLRVPIPIYGTIWILVVAYLTTFAPYAMRYVHPAMLQIHRELEESAYASGASTLVTFQRILLPLLRPALTSAWAFVFLLCVRELSVASLLYTAHTPVVATQILDMHTNGNLNQLSAFGTLVAVLSVLVVALVYRVTGAYGFTA